jgi:hypothetical protein
VPGARGQHFGLDAQRQQVLAEVVVDFARDALALEFLDLVGVGGQAPQLLVRELQLGLAVAQLLGHFLGHLDGARRRDEVSVWNSRYSSSAPTKPHSIGGR